MENKTYIDGLIANAKKAQSFLVDYNQEQTDALVKAIGKIIYDNREILSNKAVEETGLGVLAGKIVKHDKITTSHWAFLKDKPSVGLIEVDEINGIYTYAKPIGVIACLTPSTNPTTTAVGNAMHALKCRNAVIVSPHPRAKKCTAHAVSLMNEAIISLGGPANLIQSIEEPSLELTDELMRKADVIVATGGSAMVKSAYSSGKPSYGVGPGNVQIIVDRDYDNYPLMVAQIMGSRMYDNGMPCTGEQTLIMPKEKADEIIKIFEEKGAYMVTDPTDIQKLREAIFKKGFDGPINVDIVGHPAAEVAKYANVSVPEGTKLLITKLDKFGKDEVLCREIMCPFVRYFVYENFEDAINIAKTNLLMEGAGHSSGIYSNNNDNIQLAGNQIPVARFMVSQANSNVAGNTFTNGLDPTISIGCGSWGNNSISENLTYKHLMNKTRISFIIKDAPNPTAEEIWA
ncbi:aldehyde dehydrogenase family protein [Sedimentibacter sp.]|uniref:aldehyde dehydrogenase family protein n=1 Tax=Sedimentibacter sp. TaxID=1960295 RepID=UPI0028983E3A|nr:aldehyde dehydrogenase family protein [Sedimentibacter sp.]